MRHPNKEGIFKARASVWLCPQRLQDMPYPAKAQISQRIASEYQSTLLNPTAASQTRTSFHSIPVSQDVASKELREEDGPCALLTHVAIAVFI